MTPRKSKLSRSRVAQIGTCAGLLCASLLMGIGCQSASVRRSDELESRLREQQALIERLTASLDRVETDRNVVRREAAILRDELVRLQPSTEVVHAAHSLSRVDRVEILPLLSGGLDRDEIPGDELVSLLIAPRDSNGETHRVQGALSLWLRDISHPDGSHDVSSAEFSETESAALWHNGIVGRGFRVVVPLPGNLKSGDITAQVRFTTNAGRQFDTLYPLQVTPQSNNTTDLSGE